MAGDTGQLRIGELSKRVGVSPELLRAWERRYGLLQPTRSSGGLRLYSAADVERVRAMQRHLGEGLAAAEAAELASRQAAPSETVAAIAPEAARAELAAALDAYDEPAAQAVFDRLQATMTSDSLLADVVMPYLSELGDRWASGAISVAQEHFAASVVRGRLLGLGRGWGLGVGPLAVLACLPEEQHDLGLIVFGLALRSRGWRIVYLGADVPLETIEEACDRLHPQLVVVNAVASERIAPVAASLADLAARHRVAIGGAAATAIPPIDGVTALVADPVSEAKRVTVAA